MFPKKVFISGDPPAYTYLIRPQSRDTDGERGSDTPEGCTVASQGWKERHPEGQKVHLLRQGFSEERPACLLRPPHGTDRVPYVMKDPLSRIRVLSFLSPSPELMGWSEVGDGLVGWSLVPSSRVLRPEPVRLLSGSPQSLPQQ